MNNKSKIYKTGFLAKQKDDGNGNFRDFNAYRVSKGQEPITLKMYQELYNMGKSSKKSSSRDIDSKVLKKKNNERLSYNSWMLLDEGDYRKYNYDYSDYQKKFELHRKKTLGY